MPSFEEYFAGSMLANAPGWATIALMSYLYEIALIGEELIQIALLFSYGIGGIIGAYLVANKAYRDRFRVGIEVGLAAFIINMIFTAIVLTSIPTLHSLIGLVVGGAIGGVISARKLKEQ